MNRREYWRLVISRSIKERGRFPAFFWMRNHSQWDAIADYFTHK